MPKRPAAPASDSDSNSPKKKPKSQQLSHKPSQIELSDLSSKSSQVLKGVSSTCEHHTAILRDNILNWIRFDRQISEELGSSLKWHEAHFALSDKDNWKDDDDHFCYSNFYNEIVNVFKDDPDNKVILDTLNFWKCLEMPTDLEVCSHPSNPDSLLPIDANSDAELETKLTVLALQVAHQAHWEDHLAKEAIKAKAKATTPFLSKADRLSVELAPTPEQESLGQNPATDEDWQ
ncbi:hypothetical protein BT96DRAFT_1008778 [Gymnopus androsaceus JB14]|uniref:Uncharacterized protein n=1 Tax=Gymnopus androsaceus JB14 TaxID=1447944 RepID=A0A6A4GEC2_9AGAR|nr:hypothetical protein BT96DRAFT_1008778 [Gymnopus androsaceus JB14]